MLTARRASGRSPRRRPRAAIPRATGAPGDAAAGGNRPLAREPQARRRCPARPWQDGSPGSASRSMGRGRCGGGAEVLAPPGPAAAWGEDRFLPEARGRAGGAPLRLALQVLDRTLQGRAVRAPGNGAGQRDRDLETELVGGAGARRRRGPRTGSAPSASLMPLPSTKSHSISVGRVVAVAQRVVDLSHLGVDEQRTRFAEAVLRPGRGPRYRATAPCHDGKVS